MDGKPTNEEKKFIQENVSARRTSIEKLLVKAMKSVGFGMLFGIAALVTMVALRPTAVSLLTPQTQETDASSDGDASDAQTGTDDMSAANAGGAAESTSAADDTGAAADGSSAVADGSSAVADGSDSDNAATGDLTSPSAADQGSTSSDPSASGVQTDGASSDDTDAASCSDISCTAEDLAQVWQDIAAVADKADSYVVDVCSVRNATDWFDNHFEKKDIYSGIIISAKDSEICVLTPAAAVSSADSLRVILPDGRLYPAQLKKSDSLTNLAVVSFDPDDSGMVSAETIEETHSQDGGTSSALGQSDTSHGSQSQEASGETYPPIEAISLDTSGAAARGDLAIAVGSPRGMTHSVAYTWLSYTTDPISITDGTTRLFYADRDISSVKGTWIIDLEGRLIGWLCDDLKEDDTDSQVIMSIADYRDILESMVSGEDQAYLGVSVVDMDGMHSGPDYPEGVYVKSVAFGGPAYASGLQPGDYIADIGGHRITSLRSFKYAISHIQAGSTVTVLIYRQSKDEYKNIVFEVETGLRTTR